MVTIDNIKAILSSINEGIYSKDIDAHIALSDQGTESQDTFDLFSRIEEENDVLFQTRKFKS